MIQSLVKLETGNDIIHRFAITAALVSFACRPPEYKAFTQSPPIVEVNVTIAANVDDASALGKEFAAALRAQLASYVTVVPEGVNPPLDAVRLCIEIDKFKRVGVDPAVVGAGAALAAGAAHVAHRHRGSGGGNDFLAILDAILFGLHVALDIENSQQNRIARLGFVPPKISGLLTLGHTDGKSPIFADGLKSRSVIDAMTPIYGRGDSGAAEAEVARAFAKVITGKLKGVFDWQAKAVPSWYEPLDSRYNMAHADAQNN